MAAKALTVPSLKGAASAMSTAERVAPLALVEAPADPARNQTSTGAGCGGGRLAQAGNRADWNNQGPIDIDRCWTEQVDRNIGSKAEVAAAAVRMRVLYRVKARDVAPQQ